MSSAENTHRPRVRPKPELRHGLLELSAVDHAVAVLVEVRERGLGANPATLGQAEHTCVDPG